MEKQSCHAKQKVWTESPRENALLKEREQTNQTKTIINISSGEYCFAKIYILMNGKN